MSVYKSTPHAINLPVEKAFENISNLSRLQEYLDNLPKEELARIGEIRFTDNSILIKAAAVGEIALNVTERVAPERVRFAAANAPVRMEALLNLTPATPETSSLVAEIDVDIPAMLKPMIGGKLQEAADKMADMVSFLLNK